MGSEQSNGVPTFISRQGNTSAGPPRENIGDDANLVDRNQRVASRDENVHKRTTKAPRTRRDSAYLTSFSVFLPSVFSVPLWFVYSCCDVCKICRVTSSVSRCLTSIS